ncbi:MAG: hypothetical protein ACYTX0_33275 [Nostoc sp.]
MRDYIANANPSAAREVATRLQQIIKKLLVMPNLGKPGWVFSKPKSFSPKGDR